MEGDRCGGGQLFSFSSSQQQCRWISKCKLEMKPLLSVFWKIGVWLSENRIAQVQDPRPQIGSPTMEENNFLTARSRRALASRGGERNVLVESPAWNLDPVEIIPQTVHNGHPWAQNALLETKTKTISFQNDPMNMALQPTLLQYYPYNKDVRATNFLRGTIRPDPPEAPWGFVVPSSYISQSGKRAGIFNYRFIRI